MGFLPEKLARSMEGQFASASAKSPEITRHRNR